MAATTLLMSMALDVVYFEIVIPIIELQMMTRLRVDSKLIMGDRMRCLALRSILMRTDSPTKITTDPAVLAVHLKTDNINERADSRSSSSVIVFAWRACFVRRGGMFR